MCPFHGWRWNLDGENTYIYGAHAFDPELLAPDKICLRQARVEIWAGSRGSPWTRPLLRCSRRWTRCPGCSIRSGWGR